MVWNSGAELTKIKVASGGANNATSNFNILWHVDQLLGGDREIGDFIAAVVRQAPANNYRGMVFSARSAKQQLKINRRTVFSVRSVPRCYKQGKFRV
jgi:hypothetical protein